MSKGNIIRRIASSLAAPLILVVACSASNLRNTVSTVQITESEHETTNKTSAGLYPSLPTERVDGRLQVKEVIRFKRESPVISSSDKALSKPFVYDSSKYQQAPSSSPWQFSVAPYLYAAGIRGTIGARGRSIEIDASFGNVLSNLDLGLMGTFEARKGKFVFVNDLIWTKMSAERDTPVGLYSDAKLGVNLFIFDPEVGYRVTESKAGSFDVLGGVRVWSVESNLNLRTGVLPGFDVSQRKTFAAPVIGARGLINLSPKFYISSKFDIGGFGAGPDITTQFYGGVGFKITPKIALIGGYRYLLVDYDDSEGFLFDTNMNGLVFGAKFSF